MKRTLVLLCLALAAFGLWLGHLGYFGGPVFTTVAATAPAAPDDANTAVILLSGDMGSRTGMSPKIAERLAARGIPVTLVNSLSYFRHKRTPAEASVLIAAAIRQTLAAGKVHRLVLMGQSYGADMLPHHRLAAMDPAGFLSSHHLHQRSPVDRLDRVHHTSPRAHSVDWSLRL